MNDEIAKYRGGSVENDYLIKRVQLDDLVGGALKRQAHYLIARRIGVQAADLFLTVFTDVKRPSFILRQITDDAVKYRCTRWDISARGDPDRVTLSIRDAGVGLLEKDVPRISAKVLPEKWTSLRAFDRDRPVSVQKITPQARTGYYPFLSARYRRDGGDRLFPERDVRLKSFPAKLGLCSERSGCGANCPCRLI
jgi:hypothetical protein